MLGSLAGEWEGVARCGYHLVKAERLEGTLSTGQQQPHELQTGTTAPPRGGASENTPGFAFMGRSVPKCKTRGGLALPRAGGLGGAGRGAPCQGVRLRGGHLGSSAPIAPVWPLELLRRLTWGQVRVLSAPGVQGGGGRGNGPAGRQCRPALSQASLGASWNKKSPELAQAGQRWLGFSTAQLMSPGMQGPRAVQ